MEAAHPAAVTSLSVMFVGALRIDSTDVCAWRDSCNVFVKPGVSGRISAALFSELSEAMGS